MSGGSRATKIDCTKLGTHRCRNQHAYNAQLVTEVPKVQLHSCNSHDLIASPAKSAFFASLQMESAFGRLVIYCHFVMVQV